MVGLGGSWKRRGDVGVEERSKDTAELMTVRGLGEVCERASER